MEVQKISGRGVTANMLDLGSSDSGFESQRPDKTKFLVDDDLYAKKLFH